MIFAISSFGTEGGIYSLSLAIGSGAIWLLGASIGHRFFESASSVKYLSLATTTMVMLWWVMNDGVVSTGEGFLLAGLAVWLLTSLGSQLRGKAKEYDRSRQVDGN